MGDAILDEGSWDY